MNKLIFAGCLLGVLLFAMPSTANPNSLRVNAPILAVVPVFDEPETICDVPPPSRAEGLVARLRWDLEQRCRTSGAAPSILGYRVDYEWDGQRFSTQLAEQPQGDTLPLQLRID